MLFHIDWVDRNTDLACAWVCGGVAYWQSKQRECWTVRLLPKNRWLPQHPPPQAAPAPHQVAPQGGRDLMGEVKWRVQWQWQAKIFLFFSPYLFKEADLCWTLPPHYCSHWSGHPWQPSLETHTRTPVPRETNAAFSLTMLLHCLSKTHQGLLKNRTQ